MLLKSKYEEASNPEETTLGPESGPKVLVENVPLGKEIGATEGIMEVASWVEAEQVIDGGRDVGGGDGVLDRFGSDFVVVHLFRGIHVMPHRFQLEAQHAVSRQGF